MVEFIQQAKVMLGLAQRYMGLSQRIDGYRASDPSLQKVRVPAIDTAGGWVRLLTEVIETHPPLSTELR